ncbi:MAG TPA: hypothetical protein VN442_05990 [Bryobacteraceae bacterium]|nr:hypothetical protein [Bryobacteraceae bacterium]
MKCTPTILLAAACSLAAADFRSARLAVEVNDATGALSSITDRKDGRLLAGRSFDSYALQPAPERETRASELNDRVVRRNGGTLACENPSLPGILIEKTYSVEGSVVSKRVRFQAKGKDLGYFKYGTSTTVPAEFYKSGYLNNPSRHVVNKAVPYIKTAGIAKEIQIYDFNPRADHYLVIFTNPVLQRGLAQYRFKVDGHFVHPLSSYAYEPSLYYGPEGWRMGAAAKWLSEDREDLSCEIRWHLFDGDHLAFHNDYLNLPELRETWETKVPAWMGEVKGIISWDWQSRAVAEYGKRAAGGTGEFAKIKAAADSLSSGYLMVLVRGVFPNTRAYMRDPIPTPRGPLARAQLQQWVRQLQALSPRIKVGPITWQWAFLDKDPVVREHPEWTVHGPDGKPGIVVTAWEGEKAAAQLLTPEARRFVLDQYAGIVKAYNFDFIYMDTGQGGVTLFDWRTKRSAQDYDWGLLFKGIRDAARSNGGGAFYNGIPNLFSLYSDIGYYEGFNPFREHWQARSDRLVLSKIYQRPNAKRTIPLYWDDDKGDIVENYPKLCYSLAIKPGGFDYRGEYNAQHWPLIGALLEIEGAELAPAARWEPCWWRRETDVEVYALRLPGAALLTVQNHVKAKQTVEAGFDLAPFGFDPAKPLHLWRFDPKAVGELRAENPDKMTEAQAATRFKSTGRPALRAVNASFVANVPYPKGGRLTRSVEVAQDRVTILMATQSATLAYARDGQATHFLLPSTGAPGERTIRADRELPANLAASWKVRVSAAPAAAVADNTGGGVPFEGGARIYSFKGGAKLAGTAIEIPPGGTIEATGLAVTTVRASTRGEIWIHYLRKSGGWQLHKYAVEGLPPGGEKELLVDLQQFAPPDWAGRVRVDAKGGAIRIVFNSGFQLF